VLAADCHITIVGLMAILRSYFTASCRLPILFAVHPAGAAAMLASLAIYPVIPAA